MRVIKILFWVLVAIVCALALSRTVIKYAKADENEGTNIDSIEKYTWDDISGWTDYHETHTVNVKSLHLEGYATSPIGDISLDCAQTRIGNVCASSIYGVCNGPGPRDTTTCPNGDGDGFLTGYAWNDLVGWISFSCNQETHGGQNKCVSSNYGVSIDSNGDLSGFAWNDLVGWINFDSGTVRVNTSWRTGPLIGTLDSSTIDTKNDKGTVLQSIIWQGTQPAGTSVDFQIATSNCTNGASNPPICSTGVWTFKGPNQSITNYYGTQCPAVATSNPGAGANTPICVDKNQTKGAKYIRYRVRLTSNPIQSLTPHIKEIILNWAQ